MKKTFPVLLLAVAIASAEAQHASLEPLAGFGLWSDGSLRPDDGHPFLTAANREQRGFVYNPATDHLIIANRAGAPSLNILNGSTAAGADPATMDLSALIAGGDPAFPINLIGVADDGALYVGNLTVTNSPPEFRLYRWANESALQQLVFAGDPSNGGYLTNTDALRWGDTMAVRGSGSNTEILISSESGTIMAMLRPADASMTSFTSTLLVTDAPLSDLGRGLAFGTGNTFWVDGGNAADLLYCSYDLNAGTATILNRIGETIFPSQSVNLGVLNSSNLLVSLSMESANDVVKLYDISTVATPLILDRKPFPVNNGNSGPFPGAVSFGNGRVYILDANNGIMAFSLGQSSASLAPEFFLSPPGSETTIVGSDVSIPTGADGSPAVTYQWQKEGLNLPGQTNATLSLTNVQVADSGNYTVVATNTAGSASKSVLLRVLFESLIAYEPFDYTVGENLVDQTNAQFQAWTQPGTTPSDTLIAASNLSVLGLASAMGNSVTNGGGGAEIRFVPGTNVTSGTLYYSIALRVDDFGTAFAEDVAGPKYMFAFHRASGNSRVTRVIPKPVTNEVGTITGYQLGLVKIGNVTTPVYDPRIFAAGETVFVVGSYTFQTGGDISRLWINPDQTTFGDEVEPAPSLTAPQTTNTLASIDRFSFLSYSVLPAAYTLDELRIGSSWEAVTPPGEQVPAIPASLNIVRAGNSVTVSWPNSSSGYILESTPAFSTNSWSIVPHSISGTNFSATVNISGGAQFFRLRQ